MKKKKSGIGGFFKEFGEAVVKGDLFVKLSLVWMGAGYIRRKQIIKGILMTLLEVAVIVFTFGFATEYVRLVVLRSFICYLVYISGDLA